MRGEVLTKMFGDITAAFHDIGAEIGKDRDQVVLDIFHALSVELHISLRGFHEDLVVLFLGVPQLLLILDSPELTL